MPTAGDIRAAQRRSTPSAPHESRPFRERLLDFAREYEVLEQRCDSLVLSNQELKVKLELTSGQGAFHSSSTAEDSSKAEIEQLREQAHRATALAEEVARLQKGITEREEQLAKVEAAAAAEAKRAAEAQRQADERAKTLEETAQAAEVLAKRSQAELQDLSEELRKKATEERLLREQVEVEKRRAGEAAAEALAKARAVDAEAAEARAMAEAEMKAAAEERARADAEVKAAADARAQADAEAEAAEARRAAEASARLEADAKTAAEERQAALVGAKQEPRPNGRTQAELGGKKAAGTRRSTRWSEDELDSGERREGIAHVLPTLGRLMDSDWHGSYEHSPTAKARLFVFYGAGGRGARFGSWQKIVKALFPEIEMLVFEYPGHGGHKAELCSDVSQLEQEFSQQVIQFKDGFQNYFNCPFAIIGQSTGARFGVSLVQKLCSIGARPEKFYAVGRAPPLVPGDDPSIPQGAESFLEWVAENVLPAGKETYKAMLSGRTQSELQAEEQMWRADFAMNSTPVPQLPRKWRVGRTGKLIKRPESDLARRVRIEREPGSEVYVTGEEERGKGGEKWVKIDTVRDNVKPGWWLVHGDPVGLNQELLEPVDSKNEPVDEQSLFWKAHVPFQIHYSLRDAITNSEDGKGQQRPLREWNRLTQFEPEFVEHEDLLHDELLMHKDVLKYICHDFARTCRLR